MKLNGATCLIVESIEDDERNRTLCFKVKVKVTLKLNGATCFIVEWIEVDEGRP